MPSWPGVFQFDIFLRVAQIDSWCMSTSDPNLSPCKSFFMLFIHSTFLLCSFCSHVHVGWIFFRYFGITCFVCTAWPGPDIVWVSLLPLNIFWTLGLSYCFVLVFSFQHFFTYLLLLRTLACCCSFFTCPFSLRSHTGFVFYLLHKLARLDRWCCPLGYLLISYLAFWFLSWLFSILVLERW